MNTGTIPSISQTKTSTIVIKMKYKAGIISARYPVFIEAELSVVRILHEDYAGEASLLDTIC